MAPPIPTDQDKAFDTKTWTREVDDKFIDVLVDEAVNGRHHIVGNNNLAIRTAMLAVKKEFDMTFDFMCCYVKYLKLKQRFRLFRWITMLTGVYHNQLTHEIKCSSEVWEYICEKEKLSSVYMLKGEQKYDELKCLFDDKLDALRNEEANQVPMNKVIEISSDHEEGPNGTIVVGFDDEDDADNRWWKTLDPLSKGEDKFLSDEDLSAPTAHSSNEPKKGKEKVSPAKRKNITCRLWHDEGSSTASSSPLKKK